MHLQAALDFYLDGHRREGNAHCGINAASLHAMLGHETEAKSLSALSRSLRPVLLDRENLAEALPAACHAIEARKNGRLGLVSMRERAEMLGGRLEIHAQPGNGTVVRAAVPVNGARNPRK